MVYNAVFEATELPYEHQEEALLAWLRGRPVLLVTPTNSGKSMVFLLIAMWAFILDPMAILLIVYPTTSLSAMQVAEMNRRCPVLRSTWYDAAGDSKAQKRSLESGEHRVLGITPELAGEVWFKALLRSGGYRDHLVGAIIDEVHCAETWDFRPAYAFLRELGGRKLMCTATLTKSAEPRVLAVLGLTRKLVYLIRRRIAKKDLYLEVMTRPGASSDDTHLHQLADKLLQHARGIIVMPRVIFFCKSTTMLRGYYEQIMNRMGAEAYGPSSSDFYQDCYVLRIFAQAPPEIRQFFCEEWVKNPNSKARLLLTTSLTEMGFDFDDVYDGVSSGVPATMMHFRQLLGRIARREGEAGRFVIEWNGTDREAIDDDLYTWLCNETECRHELMYKFFDEACPSTGSCCDICCVANQVDCPQTALKRVAGGGRVLAMADVPPSAELATAVRAAILLSDVNSGIDVAALSPLLTPQERASRLQGGGLEQSLCNEYADAFRDGMDMMVYT